MRPAFTGSLWRIFLYICPVKTGILGITLIKHFESCKLNAYLDSGNVPTIGWGNTTYLDGTKVKIGDTITQKQADDLFTASLPRYEKIVLSKVTRELKQPEFDALVSLAYNAGTGSKGKDYNLWSHVNNNLGKDGMLKYWQSLAITAGGKQLAGLIRRRKAEANLYVNGCLKLV